MDVTFLARKGRVSAAMLPDEWLLELDARAAEAGLVGTAGAMNRVLRTGGFVHVPEEENDGLHEMLGKWLPTLEPVVTPSSVLEVLATLKAAADP
jgi:hypothetical protein